MVTMPPWFRMLRPIVKLLLNDISRLAGQRMMHYLCIMPQLFRLAAFMSELLSIITVLTLLALCMLVQGPIGKPAGPASASPSTIDELVEEMYELKQDRGSAVRPVRP